MLLMNGLQPEEERSRPFGPSNPVRDLGQRLVMLALKHDAVLTDDHLMLSAVPFAQQHRSWLEPARGGICRDLRQQSAGRRLQPAMSLFLSAIGERANQQAPADSIWRCCTIE